MKTYAVLAAEQRLDGKIYRRGETFEADETRKDVRTLKAVKKIAETSSSSPYETKVVETAGVAIANTPEVKEGGAAEVVVEEESSQEYDRRDMQARRPSARRRK